MKKNNINVINRVHVNKHIIQSNNKTDNKQAPISIKIRKDNIKVNKAGIYDKNGELIAFVIYSPNTPLSCGAQVWVETIPNKSYIESLD